MQERVGSEKTGRRREREEEDKRGGKTVERSRKYKECGLGWKERNSGSEKIQLERQKR